MREGKPLSSQNNSTRRGRREEQRKKREKNGRDRIPDKWSRAMRGWIERTEFFGRLSGNTNFQRAMIAIGCAVILALVLSPSFRPSPREYDVGDIALKDISATGDLLVEDKASTEKRRHDAADLVLPVYDYDPTVLQEVEDNVTQAFALLGDLLAPDNQPAESRETTRQQIEEKLGITLRSNQWAILEKQFDPSLAREILRLLRPVLTAGVVADRRFLEEEPNRGFTMRNIVNHEERKDDNPAAIMDVGMARQAVKQNSENLIQTHGRTLYYLVSEAAAALIRPTLTFNLKETEDRKTQAVESVAPVYFSVKKGEMIVREGDPIQADDLVKLRAFEALQTRVNTPLTIMGWMLVVFLLLMILYDFSTKNIRKITPTTKDLLFLALIIVGTAILLKVSAFVTDSLETGFPDIPSTSYYYLFPVAAGAMLIRIVLNSETALVFSVVAGYLTGLLLDNSLFFFVYALAGSIVGAHAVARCEQRSTLIKGGLMVSLVNVLMILFYQMASGETFTREIILQTFYGCGFGFLGGILSAFVVLAITPIVEILFAYTTDIKLLELANSEQPILQDLIIQAPETHSHSVIIGNLVEASARAINANPILAKVAAYYHDIGKIKKPMYFIENQKGGENPHNKLTPSMSSLILISHVKDGVALAKEKRLGQKIVDIIQQHHGTSLISYFYQKAKEKENPGVHEVNEKDYRYPGPKPQTKEAGIVMLADAVEAASRTLSDPTPSRIKGLTQQIINKIFADGQLDECELTLKDLHQIGNSFNRILNAIFHQRIDYPSTEETGKKKKNHENLNSKSPAHPAHKSPRAQKKGPDDPRDTRPDEKGAEHLVDGRSYYS